jgi:hypothetical protein
MRYAFQLVNQFVRVSDSDTSQVLHIIPINTIVLRKINANEFSFSVPGENISPIINWTTVSTPNYLSYANIDLFLVDLAAVMNAAIVGGGGGASVDSTDIIGGVHQVSTTAARDAIPVGKRYFGMLVTVNADSTPSNNTTWILANLALGGITNTLTDNNNWVLFQRNAGNNLFMYYNFS